MRMLLLIFFAALLTTAYGEAPPNEETYRVFDGKGGVSDLAAIVKALDGVDVVFLGEQHTDAVAHALELEIFTRAIAEYAARRRVALSLEMFERDVQIVLDEYMADQITEANFLASSRPWKNYAADYRPLVDLARAKKLDVVAANAPRRYINMVSRNGRGALLALSKEARGWLAPLPYGEPSDVYAKKFKALMGRTPEAAMGIDNILASQALWDATMANSVARYLKKNKESLVVHLNGSFHTEGRLGTVEHLLKYRPKARVLVVTMRQENDFKTFVPARHAALGDFVILTAPMALPQGGGGISHILNRMDVHNKTLQSLKADLTLVRHDKQINTTDTATGTAIYLPKTTTRKMYLRIDWTKPALEQAVLIGDSFELYLPRLNNVYSGTLAKVTAFGFMNLSLRQLTEQYSILYLGTEQLSGGVNTWCLELIPNPGKDLKPIKTWIDADGLPRQVQIKENNGDTSTITLSNLQKNVTVQASVFQLNYPSTVKKLGFR